MIREHGRKDRYYVIDINYFPGQLSFSIFVVATASLLCVFVILCTPAGYNGCSLFMTALLLARIYFP
jgi:hypothetical protein